MNDSISLSVVVNSGCPRFVAIQINGLDGLPAIYVRDAEALDRLIERLLQARTIAFGLPLIALPTTGFDQGRG